MAAEMERVCTCEMSCAIKARDLCARELSNWRKSKQPLHVLVVV